MDPVCARTPAICNVVYAKQHGARVAAKMGRFGYKLVFYPVLDAVKMVGSAVVEHEYAAFCFRHTRIQRTVLDYTVLFDKRNDYICHWSCTVKKRF